MLGVVNVRPWYPGGMLGVLESVIHHEARTIGRLWENREI